MSLFCSTDTQAELELVKNAALANGANNAVIARHWSEGGAGAAELADALIAATQTAKSNFNYLYDLNSTIEEKIVKIAKEMYGAGSVEFAAPVKDKIRLYYEQVLFYWIVIIFHFIIMHLLIHL